MRPCSGWFGIIRTNRKNNGNRSSTAFYKIKFGIGNRRNVERRHWLTRLPTWKGKDEGSEGWSDPINSLANPAQKSPAEWARIGDAQQALNEALKTLPSRQQQVFLLRAWEGLNVAENSHSNGLFPGNRQNALFACGSCITRNAGGLLAMKEQHQEEEFLRQVKKTLDASVESLDAGIYFRLTQARNVALKRQRTATSLTWKWLSFPLGGLVTAVLMWMIITFHVQETDELAANITIEELEIVTSGDTMELLLDLDFYLWLSENQEQHG